MYLLFGIKLVSGCLIFKDQHANGFSGNTICTSSGNLTIPEMDHEVYMTGVFSTAVWEITHNTDWGCAGGSCPSIDACESMQHSLRRINNKYWIKDYCYSFQKGCFAGRGCRYGNYELIYKELYNVFLINYISIKPDHVLAIGDCVFDMIRDIGQVVGSQFLVKNDNSSWLCPHSSNLGSPQLYNLGDLQILNNGKSVLFPWNSVKCSSDWYSSNCSLPKSFLSTLHTNCQILPTMTNWGYMKYIRNKLFLQNNNAIEIKSKCNKTSTLNTVNCSSVSVNLWGTRQHESGLYLTISAASNQSGLDVKIPYPCSGDEITVPCDGRLHFYTVSEDQYPCNGSVLDNTLTNQQNYYLQYYDKEHFTLMDSILHVNNPLIHFISSSFGSMIVWIVIVILLCKR